MTRTGGLAVVFALLLLRGGAMVGAQDLPREGHGIFTGEVKPVLYVADVEAAAPFYRDVLGFGFEGFANLQGEPYYAEMTAAELKFGLHEPTSVAQEQRIGQARLYFRLGDLSAHRARVLARGGDAGEIRTMDWMDMFIVRDADGNEIVFAETSAERHSINPWNTRQPPRK